MENIEIVFIPEDFENAGFWDRKDCPLARAIKRRTGLASVSVGTDVAFLDNEEYRITPMFGIRQFHEVKSSDPSARHTLTLIKQ